MSMAAWQAIVSTHSYLFCRQFVAVCRKPQLSVPNLLNPRRRCMSLGVWWPVDNAIIILSFLADGGQRREICRMTSRGTSCQKRLRDDTFVYKTNLTNQSTYVDNVKDWCKTVFCSNTSTKFWWTAYIRKHYASLASILHGHNNL